MRFLCLARLYIYLRARNVERLIEGLQFHNYYLKSNSIASPAEVQHQELSTMKKHVREVTERPYRDLKSPFHNPGEGPKRDLKLDEIFTNLIVYKGRAKYRREGATLLFSNYVQPWHSGGIDLCLSKYLLLLKVFTLLSHCSCVSYIGCLCLNLLSFTHLIAF